MKTETDPTLEQMRVEVFVAEMDMETYCRLSNDPRVWASLPYPREHLAAYDARIILKDYGFIVPKSATSVEIRIKPPRHLAHD